MLELRLDIPNKADWPEQTLDHICALISRGNAPSYVEHSEVMAIGQRCVSNSGFDADKARPHSPHAMLGKLIPEKGDVLLNSTGTGTIGRSCVFDSSGAFIVDGHITVLRSKLAQFEGQWLDAVLKTRWGQSHLERFCYSGSTNQVELNRSQLAATRLPVPEVEEQRAISKILNTLDTTTYQTEAIIEKLKQIKQGLLHDLLTRGIDANGELRPPPEIAPELYKESALGWIPREWEVVPVCKAGEIQLGRQRSPATETGSYIFPYLRVANVFDGYIDYSDVLSMNFSPSEQVTYSINPGDILLNEGQSLELVGRCALYEGEPGQFCFQNTLVRFRSRPSTNPWYARNVFKYWLDSGRFIEIAKQTTSIAHLGADRFAVMSFPLPTLDEQYRIAENIGSIKKRIQTECIQANKLRMQKSALMDDLLTGRVRVTPLLSANLSLSEDQPEKPL
jgi:type I restriction enzyme S subunit